MKGYGAISALDVFKFRLSLGKGGGRIEANLGESMKEKNSHLFMEILVDWNVTAHRISITELTDKCPLYKLYRTFLD
jgi:hypothetical protein